MINCPNCGAPITSDHCEYCGSRFYDWAAISDEAPTYIKMMINNELILFKAVMTGMIVTPTETVSSFYADNQLVFVAKPPEYDLNVTFRIVPDEKGILTTRYKDKEKFGIGIK